MADDFTQRPDEAPAAWLERLLTAGMGEMTNERRADLGRHIAAARQAAGWVPRTPSVRPPEAVAASLISVAPATPGGPLFIHLKAAETVLIGPFENPDLAHKDALKVRTFLTEVIRTARADGTAPSPA